MSVPTAMTHHAAAAAASALLFVVVLLLLIQRMQLWQKQGLTMSEVQALEAPPSSGGGRAPALGALLTAAAAVESVGLGQW
jgi:ABC-type Fe3+ transport system permease subunit